MTRSDDEYEYEDDEYEYEEEEEWEDEEDEDVPEPPSRARGKRAAGDETADAGTARPLALGFLVLSPLILAYELGQFAIDGSSRSSAELLLFYGTIAFGKHAELVRWGILAALFVIAGVTVLRHVDGLLPKIFRQLVEGVIAAVLLGPLLTLGIRLLGALIEPVAEGFPGGASLPPHGAPGLGAAARVVGAAAYEELLFRLGLMSVLILLVRSVSVFLTGHRSRTWIVVAEIVAVIGSGLAFAAFHLETVTGWLGAGGEPWNAAVFTWRALAGMLLAGLFRWRGIGVAAWAHGLFNLALVLGAGPDVFL